MISVICSETQLEDRVTHPYKLCTTCTTRSSCFRRTQIHLLHIFTHNPLKFSEEEEQTLKQECFRATGSAMCVQRFDDSRTLQFALRIAFRCVLHRCENLDIHR